MPTVPMRDLGLTGWVQDLEPQDVPFPKAFTTMRNCRISNKAIATLPGPRSVLNPGGTILYSAPYLAEGANTILVITETAWKIYSSLAVSADVTPAAAWTPSGDWYHVQQGTTLIVTNGVDAPFVITDSTAQAIPMPGWPATYTCGVMESYKNYLVAVRVSVAGIPQPDMIKWSHPVAPGDTTYDWDHTDPGNLAGETPYQLSGQGIRGARPARDSLFIYYDEAAVRMSLVGGQFVMNLQTLFTDDGMVSPRAVVVAKGVSYVFGFRDIYSHDGVTPQSLTDARISRWLISNVDYSYPIDSAYNPERNEVCFLFRTSSSQLSDHMLIINLLWRTITLAEMQDGGGSGIYRQIILMPRLETANLTYVDVPDTDYSDVPDLSYRDVYATAVDMVFYGVRNEAGASELVNLDPRSSVNLFPRRMHVEHSLVDLDEVLNSVGDTMVYVSRLFPQVNASGGELEFTIGAVAHPSAGVSWGAPVLFDPANDYAVDLRECGRYLAFRLRSTANTLPCEFSGIDMEMVVIGAQ